VSAHVTRQPRWVICARHVDATGLSIEKRETDSGLFFVFVDRDGLQIFRFEDLATIQAPDVINTITPRYHLCSLMGTTDTHKECAFPQF